MKWRLVSFAEDAKPYLSHEDVEMMDNLKRAFEKGLMDEARYKKERCTLLVHRSLATRELVGLFPHVFGHRPQISMVI